MDIRLKELLIGLKRRDPAICGDAPGWIIEKVESRLEALTTGNKKIDDKDVADFCRGAGRYISDSHCEADCDLLSASLSGLLK